MDVRSDRPGSSPRGRRAPDRAAGDDGPLRRSFAVQPKYRTAGRVFGIRADDAEVYVDAERFRVRFGPWTVDTPLANVAGVEVTGPYAVAKTIGPAHLSFSDRGLTFATTSERGACISFREPVRGIDPLGLIRHPGLTVTVEDPESFAVELSERVEAARFRLGRT